MFCDCPGISENEQTFGPTLDNVEKSYGIILVVDAYKANAGIEEGKVTSIIFNIVSWDFHGIKVKSSSKIL